MKKLILSAVLLVLFASSAQAVTVAGYSYPDLVSAEIDAQYSNSANTLTLTVENTSSYLAALTGILFSLPDTMTVVFDSASYSNGPDGIDSTSYWGLTKVKTGNITSAEPMSLYEGLNTSFTTGKNFNGGDPNDGLDPGWTATFLFTVTGEIADPLNIFIARFQRVGEDGESSDFAHPTPLPSALLLLGSGLAGLVAFRRRRS